MAKEAPISVRLDSGTNSLVADIAKREGRSRSAVVVDLLSESAKTRMFPGIGFKGGSSGRRAYIIGSRYDVWQIIDLVNRCGASQTEDDFGLLDRQIQIAFLYYEKFTAEVDAKIEQSAVGLDEIQAIYPGLVVDEVKVRG